MVSKPTSDSRGQGRFGFLEVIKNEAMLDIAEYLVFTLICTIMETLGTSMFNLASHDDCTRIV